jgi:hypothetical protein
MNNKSKEGFANLLTLIGICLIVGGIYVSVMIGLEDGWGTSFLMCLVGTVLNFVAGYLKNGYFKFFN